MSFRGFGSQRSRGGQGSQGDRGRGDRGGPAGSGGRGRGASGSSGENPIAQGQGRGRGGPRGRPPVTPTAASSRPSRTGATGPATATQQPQTESSFPAASRGPRPSLNIRTPSQQAEWLADEALGDRLRREARDAVANADGPLRNALQEHFFDLLPAQRPTDNEVITRIVDLVRISELRLEPSDAALRLANADWDLDLAMARYMQERDLEEESKGLSEAPSDLSPDVKEEGGGEDSEDSEDSEESEEGEEESEDDEGNLSPRTQMRRLNFNVDRSQAVKGQRDNSKKNITLRTVDGRPREAQYQGNVNWNDSNSIHALNRWRSQYFRRSLGPARPHRLPLLHIEKRFLFDVHRRFMLGQQAQHGQHHQVDYGLMDWAEVTREFNNNFQGRLLPGETLPRPMRTESALRSARPRIPEIVALTGIAARKNEEKKGGKKEGKKRGKKEDEKDEAGKRKGPKK